MEIAFSFFNRDVRHGLNLFYIYLNMFQKMAGCCKLFHYSLNLNEIYKEKWSFRYREIVYDPDIAYVSYVLGTLLNALTEKKKISSLRCLSHRLCKYIHSKSCLPQKLLHWTVSHCNDNQIKIVTIITKTQ